MSEEEDTTHVAKTSYLKGWAAIIAAFAALVTAISAFLRPPQEPAARAAYETLAVAVKENSQQNAKNHDDIEGLRAFLEGYIRGNGRTPELSSMDAGTVPTPPVPTVTVHPLASSSASTVRPASSRPVASALSMGGMGRPAPPTIGPRPPVWEPPSFNQVQSKK
jgi:hypothetical protein